MKTGERRNPGDPEPRELVERMIRVDQAGEFGAVRIYEGQLAALRWTGRAQRRRPQDRRDGARRARASRGLRQMMAERRVRPTALSPLWNLAGFALGAATALMGDKAAMACTVGGRGDDRRALCAARPPRSATTRPSCARPIEKFRADEIAHREEALASGAEQAPAYAALTGGHQGRLAARDLAVDEDLIHWTARILRALMSAQDARCQRASV